MRVVFLFTLRSRQRSSRLCGGDAANRGKRLRHQVLDATDAAVVRLRHPSYRCPVAMIVHRSVYLKGGFARYNRPMRNCDFLCACLAGAFLGWSASRAAAQTFENV